MMHMRTLEQTVHLAQYLAALDRSSGGVTNLDDVRNLKGLGKVF